MTDFVAIAKLDDLNNTRARARGDRREIEQLDVDAVKREAMLAIVGEVESTSVSNHRAFYSRHYARAR